MSLAILELEAINHKTNTFRFYRLDVQKDLFNYWMLTTIHGRIGTQGITKKFAFKNIKDIRIKINDILKIRRTAPKRIGVSYNVKEIYDPLKMIR